MRAAEQTKLSAMFKSPPLHPAAALVMGVLAAGPAIAQGSAQSGSRFDGTWSVILTCDAARDGAAGYTLRFSAVVKDGLLHGEYGVRGQAGSLSLDGPIQMDGSALLSARGLTGNPDYVIGRLTSATPYAYRLQSRFEGARGTGARLEVRRCDAVFSKQ